jgi:hypothetical protein
LSTVDSPQTGMNKAISGSKRKEAETLAKA